MKDASGLQLEDVVDQTHARPHRLGQQRQAGHHRSGRLRQDVFQKALEIIGVALHHGRLRIARAQQPAEHRIEFDQHQARRIDAAIDQRFGDGAGARSELDHGPRNIDIDMARHGAGEKASRRRDRAGRQWLVQPGADESDFVVETKALLVGNGWLETHVPR